MQFPWLKPNVTGSADGAARREAALVRELAHRAALLYRLGFAPSKATQRLCAEVAWEFDPPGSSSPHRRPSAVSDVAIGAIVKDVYLRRPSG
jgi:hypothetical protein